MHIELKHGYAMEVTGPEMRLIGLALAGKLQRDDIRAAADLNAKLCAAKVAVPKQAHEVAIGAAQNAAMEAANQVEFNEHQTT